MADYKMLAIDLGASSGRGIVGSFDGKRITLNENHRFSNDPVIVNGRMYWDILRIFHEIKQSITKTVIAKEQIASIGIDTWGVDYALLDSHGRMLANPVHYRDTRTDGMVSDADSFISREELYGITGIQQMNFNTVYQLLTELRDDPDRFSLAARVLNIPDLLNYFLTGEMQNEYTILSTGALLDAATRDFSDTVLQKTGIPRNLFGKIVQPGNRIGKLLPQVQEETGKTDATIVNVASHDTASAVVAVPTQKKDFIFISSGTWSLMGTELHAPMISTDTAKYGFANEGGVLGTIRFLKNIMGLWLIQESRRQWKREGTEYSFAELEALARQSVPFRSFINPDDPSFATPGNLPERIREYCRRTGQPIPETVGDVILCIYQSLALKYRQVAESIKALTKIDAEEIYVVGGGTQDHFLCQMTADACGMRVLAGPKEATAIGNIAVQMMSAGCCSGLAEARKIIADSFGQDEYEPSPDAGRWDEAYSRFTKLN